MKWFRLYNELLDDPKVQQLNPELFKFWINILCIASKNEGKLPSIEAISYHVRASKEATDSLVFALKEAQLIHEFSNQHGTWLAPHAWQKRQYKSDTSSERVKRYRNAQRNEVVTPPETDTEQIQNKRKVKEKTALKKPSPPSKNNRGTRLKEDWDIPQEWGEWAVSDCGWDVAKVIKTGEKFKDHWLSVAGTKGVKLDWFAVWRNWCRRTNEGF